MKNGVTKDTESYNKRIGVKDRDTRQATEGTREASTTVETRARDRRRGKEREREKWASFSLQGTPWHSAVEESRRNVERERTVFVKN